MRNSKKFFDRVWFYLDVIIVLILVSLALSFLRFCAGLTIGEMGVYALGFTPWR